MMRALTLLILLFTAAAHAQLPIFTPDDFVDPRVTKGRVVFISRLVVGAERGHLDQYRPAGQDIAYVHVANSFYWSGLQVGYEHSEIRGENNLGHRLPQPAPPPPDPPCDPTPISPPICGNATFPSGTGGTGSTGPVAPAPRDAVQFSWYQAIGDRLTLRYQGSYGRQYAIPEQEDDETITVEDHDDIRGAQLDAAVRIGLRTFSGSVSVTELTRASTIEGSKQKSVTLTAFLPLVRVGPAILTTRAQFGRVTDEAAPDIDHFTPSFDLALNVARARANIHLVYSPSFQRTNTAPGPLQRTTHHQVAIYVDRALLVAVFGAE